MLLAVVFLAGCATQYDIVLNNGSTLVAHGKPKHDEVNQIYIYKNDMGQKLFVGDFKVKLIQPSSFREDKPKSPYIQP